MADSKAITDEGATWRDYPYASGPGESDGTLVLSDNRLTFAIASAGVVLDVDLDGFDAAQISRDHDGRSLLTLHYLDGTHASFWVGAMAAQGVVDAVLARPR